MEPTTYINPIGGVELYSKDEFAARGIELNFVRPMPLEYPQFGGPFVPWLSIIDVLMFNALDAVRRLDRDPLRAGLRDVLFTWKKLGKVFTPQEVPERPPG